MLYLEDLLAPSVHWYGDGNGGDGKKMEDYLNQQPFSMTATTVGYENFLGRTCTGRICSGQIQIGDGLCF